MVLDTTHITYKQDINYIKYYLAPSPPNGSIRSPSFGIDAPPLA